MYQQEVTYRYSVRTVVGAVIALVVGMSSLLFFVVISIIQYTRVGGASIIFAGIFAFGILFWLTACCMWLRDRPTLTLTNAGIRVQKFASPAFDVKWDEVKSIDDLRRFNAQTGRPLRCFEIRSISEVIKFDQFYSRLSQLLAQLNIEIEKHRIKVYVHNYDRNALRAALEAACDNSAKVNIRKQGIVREVPKLEL